MPTKPEAFSMRLAAALNARDWDTYESLMTEDFVGEYPQSGEVIRGRKNARAILEKYPGGLVAEAVDLSSARVAATEARWVRTPTFTVVRAEGSGNVATVAFRSKYPDGSTWWVINFYELRGDLLARSTTFFAPSFDPPEWRKPYVEANGTRS
jgi:hypothetical protein